MVNHRRYSKKENRKFTNWRFSKEKVKSLEDMSVFPKETLETVYKMLDPVKTLPFLL